MSNTTTATEISRNLHQQAQSALNALLIPSITEKILSLCEIKELKTARLVCQEWNVEAWKYLRRQSQISFQNDDEINLFLDHLPSSGFEPINFRLWGQLELESEGVQRFVLKLGHTIRHLNLDRVTWSNSTLWELLGKQVPNLVSLKLCFNHEPCVQNLSTLPPLEMPSLKSLSINCNFISDSCCQMLLKILLASYNINTLTSIQGIPAFPVSSRQIDFRLQRLARPRRSLPGHYYLQNPPNENNLPLNITHFLEKFAVSNSSRFGDLVLSQMILNNDKLLLEKLENLNMEFIIIENNDLVKLSKQRFPLKNLTIVLCGGSIRTNILHEALKNFHDSLVFLRINHLNKHLLCSSLSTNAIPGSGYMKKLKKLHLEEYTGNLSFAESLTILEELIISKSDFASVLNPWKHNGSGRIILPHELQVLTVENNTVKLCMAKTVLTLTLRFPRLRKLTLGHMTDESIRLIFSNLPELQELTATEGFFTDSGITGIPSVEVYKLKEMAMTDQRVKTMRIYPYIGNLKKLRAVSLESTKLSEISLLFGIAFCVRIKKISLVNPKKVQYYVGNNPTSIQFRSLLKIPRTRSKRGI